MEPAEQISKIIKLDSKYGSNKNLKKKYNIEFVSANPTGPLHVGHCRGAVLGDVLSNPLSFNGNKVTKEYYVNDYGEQIKIFVSSVYYRILEIIDNKKIRTEINDFKKSLLNFRFQKTTGQLEKTSEIKKARRKIASLKTIISSQKGKINV